VGKSMNHLSESRMRENRPSGLMRGGRSNGHWSRRPFNPSSPAYSTNFFFQGLSLGVALAHAPKRQKSDRRSDRCPFHWPTNPQSGQGQNIQKADQSCQEAAR
ncbi:MAG: hypothetical protein LV480_11485, partial [Methylacidiphilales bacterium]|nr:hypothetical protein [Candidatus Methylacidiphilales bacterium]